MAESEAQELRSLASQGGVAEADGDRDAERALVASGRAADVERAHAIANAFVAEHRLEVRTLQEDVVGDLRKAGPIRIATVLMLFPLALPLGVHVLRNVAGQGLEWLGLLASVLCVVVAATAAVLLRGRPLDRTTLGIHGTATVSVVAGAVLSTLGLGLGVIAIGALACAVVMLVLWLTMLVARLRGSAAGRLRDTEPMDRAHALGAAVRERLDAALAGSRDPETVAFLDELQRRVAPEPQQRLYADSTPRPYGSR